MIATNYPYRDAIYAAHTTYRDAMRCFIMRCLNKHPDTTPEELISKVLTHKGHDPMNLDNEIKATEAMDISNFPDIIIEHWKDSVSFSEEFNSDSTIRTDTETIRKDRKLWAHPKLEDVDPEKTKTILSLVSKVLGEINEIDEKRKVDRLRNQLFPYDSEERLEVMTNFEKVQGELTTLKKQQEATDKRLGTIEEHCTNIAETLNQLRTALKPINSTEYSINEQNQRVEVEEEDLTYEEGTTDTPSLELLSLPKNVEVSSMLKVGNTLTGRVNQIIANGVFITSPEGKGFIHLSELSLEPMNHPSDLVSLNDEVEVTVIKLNEDDNKKIPSLRLKSKHGEWIHRIDEKKYHETSRVQVTITKIHNNLGVFAKLEEGISGLIHQSTIPLGIIHQLQEGQEIQAIILDIDRENEKINLRLHDDWNPSDKLDKISLPSHAQIAVGSGT